MEPTTLIEGIKFAINYGLTPREMEILILFFSDPMTTAKAAQILKANPKTLHHTLYKLKLKGILVLKNRDSNGNYLYEFNKSLDN